MQPPTNAATFRDMPHWRETILPRQTEAAQMLAEGRSHSQIEIELDLEDHVVALWLRSPTFQAAFNHFEEEQNQRVRAATRKGALAAIEMLIGDLKAEEPKIAHSAADKILKMERAYLPSRVRIEADQNAAPTREEAAAKGERLREWLRQPQTNTPTRAE